MALVGSGYSFVCSARSLSEVNERLPQIAQNYDIVFGRDPSYFTVLLGAEERAARDLMMQYVVPFGMVVDESYRFTESEMADVSERLRHAREP